MKFTLFGKNGEVSHTSASLAGIRRHVTKTNVKRTAVIDGKRLLITLKNGGYLDVAFPTMAALEGTLGRWRNLSRVQVDRQTSATQGEVMQVSGSRKAERKVMGYAE